MKTWWAIAFGVLCGLLGVGGIIIASSNPRGEPIRLLPPPTAAPILVHVTGAVAQPGVYPLPKNCRVQDALEAAGGILPEAELGSINLAAFLQDGTRLWIPFRSQIEAYPAANSDPQIVEGSTFSLSPSQSPSALININTASQIELESLPGIGPVMAQRIIAYRKENGPFALIEDIEKVSGIGPATFEKIKELITTRP